MPFILYVFFNSVLVYFVFIVILLFLAYPVFVSADLLDKVESEVMTLASWRAFLFLRCSVWQRRRRWRPTWSPRRGTEEGQVEWAEPMTAAVQQRALWSGTHPGTQQGIRWDPVFRIKHVQIKINKCRTFHHEYLVTYIGKPWWRCRVKLLWFCHTQRSDAGLRT